MHNATDLGLYHFAFVYQTLSELHFMRPNIFFGGGGGVDLLDMQATVAYTKHGRRCLHAAPALTSLCHGWPATAGHRDPVGGGQAPDQHQRTEAHLPRDWRQRAGPHRVGEEALLLPCALHQSR